jgi:hypothetical protein
MSRPACSRYRGPAAMRSRFSSIRSMLSLMRAMRLALQGWHSKGLHTVPAGRPHL